MDQTTPNSASSTLPISPTSDDLLDLITEIENLDGLDGQAIKGIPSFECIQYIFEQIPRITSESDIDRLEYKYVSAVASAVLNRNRLEGASRLQPRVGQVRSIQRIVFRHGDTILVAWTGYGKSIVLYTVSVIMRGYITISICPAKRSGQDQYNTIAQMPGTCPLLINDETKKDKKMWDMLAAVQYTHVILGPEQADQTRFIDLLRTAAFNQKIAFVAIDELHLVYQWKDFRIAYPGVHQMRHMIPRNIPWFGCTATLSEEAQQYILPTAGFRKEGSGNGKLSFIRATSDRPNISMVISPLERGTVRNDYRRLDFLLDGVNPSNFRAIEKTIVFVDSLQKLIAARHYLLSRAKARFLTDHQAEEIIRRCDADTRPNDQERLYRDFVAEDSPCRIMLTTVALGMGMGIRSVIRVIQFGSIASGDLADLLQRFGQAVRDGKTQGIAYFFPPYWYFDGLGTDAEKPLRGRKWTGNSLKNRPANPSSLRHSLLLDDGASDSSVGSQGTSISSDGESVVSEVDNSRERVRKWTKSELSCRDRLQTLFPDLYEFANARCLRECALQFLQEPVGDDIEGKVSVSKTVCCNACYPELGRLPDLPEKADAITAPRKWTAEWFAWKVLDEYCAQQCEDLYGMVSKAVLPGSVFMPKKIQWKVATVLNGSVSNRHTEQEIMRALVDWEDIETYGRLICEWAPHILLKANDRFLKQKPIESQPGTADIRSSPTSRR